MKNLEKTTSLFGTIFCRINILFLLIFLSLAFSGCFDTAPTCQDKNVIEQEIDPYKITIDSLDNIAWEMISNDPDSAQKIAKLMIEKSEQSNYIEGLANAYNIFGATYYYKGIYNKAIENYFSCMKYWKRSKNKEKEIKVANVNINIGTIFVDQKNYTKASEHYLQSLKFFEDKKDSSRISTIYNNLGMLFHKQERYDQALDFYFKCLFISEKINNDQKTSIACNNIGNIYHKKGKYEKALEFSLRALFLMEKLNDQEGRATALMTLGKIYQDQRLYSLAIKNLSESLEIAKSISSRKLMMDNYSILSEVYKSRQDFQKALAYSELHNEMKDSLLNQESAKQIAEMEVVHETEQKESQIKVLEKDQEVQNVKIEKQRLFLFLSTGVIFLIVILVLIILKALKSKKRANEALSKQRNEIASQNQELEKQKEEIIHQKQEITDSIDYAKGIQKAILPQLREIYSSFPDSFVFYSPKDIVSGDFYFLHKTENFVVIAAADCTGHGVPGAMVSVVCSNALNRAVKEFKLTDPGQILDKARDLVVETFEKSETEIKDGMDISLLTFDIKNKKVMWAGANNPLYHINEKRELVEYKPNKQPIGKSYISEPFKTHNIEAKVGDTLYIFSDGYADQFGGPKGKKFMSKNLKELLVEISIFEMVKQGEMVSKTIDLWKNQKYQKYEQVDDNLIIGIRI